MNLQEFRKKHPFKPYQMVILRGADDKVMVEVEVISWPWEEEDGRVLIHIRTVPGDPTTLATTETSNLMRKEKE